MSKTRTGHGPNDWRDDGPQTVTAHVNNFSLGAVTGDRMVPTLSGSNYSASAAEMQRRERKRQKRHDATAQRDLNPVPKPVCGAPMKLTGDTCARRPGHVSDAAHPGHRSRTVMDADMVARQRSRPASIRRAREGEPPDAYQRYNGPVEGV